MSATATLEPDDVITSTIDDSLKVLPEPDIDADLSDVDAHEPDLEEEINEAYKQLEGILNGIKANPAAVEMGVIDEIERLFSTLPIVDTRTNAISRNLYERIHQVIAANEQIGAIMLARFITYISQNPRIGFMILTMIDEDGLDSSVNYNEVALRNTIIEFLEGIGTGSAPLETAVEVPSATYLFDLLNNDWGTDLSGYARVLTAMQNPYLRDLPFNQVYDQNTRVERLRVTLQRLENAGNIDLYNQLNALIASLVPEDDLELSNRQVEQVFSLNNLASSLEDPKLTPEEKRPIVIQLKDLIDQERQKKVMDEVLLKRVYGIVIASFRRLVLADSNTYSQNNVGPVLLDLVLDLRKKSLDDTSSPEARLIPEDTVWEPLTNRFFDALKGLNTQRADYSGVREFYLVFINDLDKCTLFGEDFIKQIFNSLYAAVPNTVAIELMCDLYEKIEDPAIDDVLDLMSIQNVNQVRSKEAQLSTTNMGRFMLWITSKSQESIIDFLDRTDDNNYRFNEVIELINILRPEIRAKREELVYEKREKASLSIDSRLKGISAALFIEIPDSAIREQGLIELKKKRSLKDKLLHSVEPVFRSNRFESAWKASVSTQLDAYTENKVLAARRSVVEVSITEMSKLVGSEGAGYSQDLEVALSMPEVRDNFIDILRELKRIIEDSTHPLYSLMTPQRRTIERILGSYLFNANVLELMPRDLIQGQINKFNGYLDGFNDDLTNYQGQAAAVSKIESGTFASIRKRLNGITIKAEEEEKLSNTYDSISSRRNIVLNDVLFIVQQPRLLKVYEQQPGFNDCLVRLVDSLAQSGLKTTSELNFVHFLLNGYNFEHDSLQDILPAQFKLRIATVLVKQLIEGDEKFRNLLILRITNDSPPPRFMRSQFANYLSAVYIYLQQEDSDARNKLRTLLDEEPAQEKTKGFFRKKRIPNARNEFLTDIQEVDDFLNGNQAVFNPQVLNYLSQIRTQAKVDTDRLAIAEEVQAEAVAVNQNLSNINILGNFEEARPFTAIPSEAIPQIEAALKIVTALIAKKTVVDNFNMIADSDPDSAIKILQMLLNLYYLNLFFNKDAGVNNSTIIMNLITNLINKLRLSGNIEVVNQLTYLVDNYQTKYAPIVDAVPGAVSVANKRKENMRAFVNRNVTVELLERGSRLRDLVSEFNQISVDSAGASSRLINILGQIRNLLADLTNNDTKLLLANIADDQYRGLIVNLHTVVMQFSRWPSVQTHVSTVFNSLISNIPDAKKATVLASIDQEVDQRIEAYRKNHKDGRSRTRRYVGNKYSNKTIQEMNQALTAAAA